MGCAHSKQDEPKERENPMMGMNGDGSGGAGAGAGAGTGAGAGASADKPAADGDGFAAAYELMVCTIHMHSYTHAPAPGSVCLVMLLLTQPQRALFGDARLQDKIGEGKFSQVYKCQGKVDHVFYAAKVLKKAEMDEEDLTALVDEVRIMKMVCQAHSEAHTPARWSVQTPPSHVLIVCIVPPAPLPSTQVNHPNLVKLVDFYDEPQHYVLVQEYCTGGELFDRIIKMVPAPLPRRAFRADPVPSHNNWCLYC